jgi:hypothetical protein
MISIASKVSKIIWFHNTCTFLIAFFEFKHQMIFIVLCDFYIMTE